MIKPERIIAILEKNVALMKALNDQQISGFAIIMSPDAEPIEFVTIGSQSDQRSFYEYLTNKLKGSVETSQYGGVRMAR